MSWNDLECLTILDSLPKRKRHRHITSAIILRGKTAYDLSTEKISQVTRTLFEFMPLSEFVSIFQLILSLAEAAESSLAFSKLLSTVSLRTIILPITKTNIMPHCSNCG
jgi:membrane protein insertase Oxa1/YidC/SpoIIIJ